MIPQFTPTADSFDVVLTSPNWPARFPVIGWLHDGAVVEPLVAYGRETLTGRQVAYRETKSGDAYTIERADQA